MRKLSAAFIALAAALVAVPVWSAAQRVQETATRASDLKFEYQVVLDEDDGPRAVAQPTVLRSGDRFSVRVRASHAAYACLFVSNSAGSFSLLRVADTDDPCARVKGEWAVLPDAEAVMRLDTRIGLERIYVVVSREPVREIETLDTRDDRVSEEWLENLRTKYSSGALWTRESGDDAVQVSFRPREGLGVAVERFAFRHQ